MNPTASKIQAEAANTFRSLLSDILPDLLAESDGPSNVDKVKEALRDVSQNYRMGLSRASVKYRSDWKEAANRCAYVFVYLVQHCNLVCYAMAQALEQGTGLGDWNGMSTLKVCSVGGGPGSDLVGLATFLELCFAQPPMLVCRVLDLYPAWQLAWDTIASYFPSRLPRVSYERCDLVQDAGLGADVMQFVQEADLITMVKSFSVVAAFLRADRSRGSVLRAILREIKPGCHLLFIDNDHDGDAQFRNDFADPSGLELMFEKRGHQSVPSGSYSLTVRNYCASLDFKPMQDCDVNIQLYRKKLPVEKPSSVSYAHCYILLCIAALGGIPLFLVFYYAFLGGIGYCIYLFCYWLCWLIYLPITHLSAYYMS